MDDGTRAAAAQALEALAHWGVPEAAPRLAKFRENIVFEARLGDRGRVALRLHRPGYQSREAISAELEWTRRLAEKALPVPEPLVTRDGSLTAAAGDRVASVVRWLPGAPIGVAERRLDGDATRQRALMRDVGRLVAGLHNATDALRLSRDLIVRPIWNAEGFLGDRPLWGRFWENPAFTDAERSLIEAARAAAWRMLPAPDAVDFGLIHADVLRENILSDGGRLSLIDFDDSGWGFRLYDLATAVVQSLEEPGLAEIVAGVIEGYAAERALGPADQARLGLFVMLRTFASAGWIATRAAQDDPRQRFYAARAIRMARAVLEGKAPWE